MELSGERGLGQGTAREAQGCREQGIKEPFMQGAVLVYKHETGRCQAEFAHKVNKFGVFGKGRTLTKENGKSHFKLPLGPHSDVCPSGGQ